MSVEISYNTKLFNFENMNSNVIDNYINDLCELDISYINVSPKNGTEDNGHEKIIGSKISNKKFKIISYLNINDFKNIEKNGIKNIIKSLENLKTNEIDILKIDFNNSNYNINSVVVIILALMEKNVIKDICAINIDIEQLGLLKKSLNEKEITLKYYSPNIKSKNIISYFQKNKITFDILEVTPIFTLNKNEIDSEEVKIIEELKREPIEFITQFLNMQSINSIIDIEFNTMKQVAIVSNCKNNKLEVEDLNNFLSKIKEINENN